MTLAISMTEDDLLAAVTDALTLYRWRWTHPRRSDRALTMGNPGVPDIIAVRPPRLLFVELKSRVGKVTPAQQDWISDLSAIFGFHEPGKPYQPEVFVIRPDQLDSFLEDIR